jgi:hypothetical protein
VSFDGVNKDRIEEMKREMREGDQPEEVRATEVIVLHDPEADKSLAISSRAARALKAGESAANVLRAATTVKPARGIASRVYGRTLTAANLQTLNQPVDPYESQIHVRGAARLSQQAWHKRMQAMRRRGR